MIIKPMRSVFGIVQRDGNKCHICGLPCDFRTVDKKLAITATRDHITPKSKGGKAHLSNLKLAHSYCNAKRGDQELTEEIQSYCREWIKYRISEQALTDAERWFQKHLKPLLDTIEYRKMYP
jgi:5-methylcytosine-specific restriction endonuclease McrA